MNFERIYDFRFREVNHKNKAIVWGELAKFFYFNHLNEPQKILDPAGGLCEFINAVPSKEKWTIDLSEDFVKKNANSDVKIIVGNNLEVDIPFDYFDAIFVSNFLEHLHTQEEVSIFLERMYKSMRVGGRIAIMGPNFKYCYKEYFDFADHYVILSDLGLAEHLYGAGFKVIKAYKKFLPLSFRGNGFLPVNKFTINTYLKLPLAWSFLGKQFLLVAEKQ
jgi:hypothetical protein